jgi:RHS repeat-associated protein
VGSGRQRIAVTLLATLLIFEAGAVAPASVVAREPSPPPLEEPAEPRPPASQSPAPSPANPQPTAGPPPSRKPSEPSPPAPPAEEEPPGIERMDLRSTHSRTFEQPDGTLLTEFFSDQTFFRLEGSAEWRPIDLSLKPSRDGESIETADAPVRLSLQPADTPSGFLRLEGGGHTIRFGLPAGTPSGRAGTKADIKEDGLFADYTEFLPGGIGLRIFPHAEGFKSFLVLPERPEMNTFSFAISGPGLDLVGDDSGGFEFRDPAGKVVGRIPRPFMEDSSELEGRGGGLYSEAVTQSVSETGDGWLLTLTVDQKFLDEAVYPVYVDPTTTNFPTASTTAGDSFVNSETPNTNYDTYKRASSPYYYEMWHGNTPGTPYYNEVFIRFNSIAETLGAVKINSAILDVYPYWQYHHYECRATWIERVAATWGAGTIKWNNKPGIAESYGTQCTVEGAWSGFNVKPYVEGIVSGAFIDYGLKLHANPQGQGGWKRIVSRNDSSNLKPRLVVSWDPFAPTAAHPIGGGPSAGRTLSWVNEDGPAQAAYEVALSANNFSSTLASSGQITSADTSWTIPSGTSLTAGSTYYWRVRTKLGSNSSFGGWSTTATFVWSPESNLGLAGHNAFETLELGNGEALSVNVATGNLVLSAPQVSLPYRGGALSLALTYNAFDSANLGMGPGWRLSTMARLTELANGNAVYAAADGSRHTFVKSGSDYIRPATLYAALTKGASAPQWTLTWRDQSVDRFTTFGSDGLLTRSQDRHGNGIDYTYYASSNRLYRATDPAGRYVEFSWDTGATPARLTSFTDWAYVSGGEVQASQTGSRRLYRFFYDAGGQLIGWANPKNTSGACPTSAEHRTCIAYTGGQLSTITKRQVPAAIVSGSIGTGTARDITTSVTYSGGRVSQVRDPEQTFASVTGTTFVWVGAASLRVVRPGTPPASQASTTTYVQVGGVSDGFARIASVLRQFGSTEIEQRTAWNTSFPVEPASVTENFGAVLSTPARTVSFAYVTSSMGLVASVTEPLTNSTTTRTTSYTYNANNDVTQVVVASGSASTTTRYCYATSGCATSGNTLTMRAQIDNWKDGTKGGAKGNEEDVTTEFLYDANGQLTRETRFNYDAAGTLLDQRAIGWEYDSNGNLLREMANYANGQVSNPGDDITPNATTNARTDLTTVHAYDTAGNRISSADPRRAIGLLICSSAMRSTDYLTRWAYDPLNVRLREVTPTTVRFDGCTALSSDSRTASYAYDAQGRLRQSTDFGGLVTASIFDRAGRTSKTLEQPPGGSATETSEATYDPQGRVLSAKDRGQLANGSLGQTAYTYDELGRQASVIEAHGSGDPVETTSGFDGLRRQTQHSYGGQTTTTRYDLSGRVTEQDDRFSCTRTSYDYRDLAITVIEGLASGAGACTGTGLRTISNTYDGLGRLVESKVTAGEGLNDIPNQTAYDGAGNARTSTSVQGGVTTSATFVLNPLDQVTRQSRSDGSLGRTNYDPVGNPTDQCHWASGPDEACKPVGSSFTNAPTRHTSTSYDARNQRLVLSDAATQTTTVYDPDHNYQLQAFYVPTANGRERQTLHAYDERHRVTSITHQLCVLDTGASDPHDCTSTMALGSSTYAYDQNDNRTQVVENNGATSSDRRYCYDAQNRLIARRTGAACTSSPDETYAYDPAGNRTQTAVGGVTTDFAYNADGQLCKIGATTCGTPNVTYDVAGRTRSWNGWWFSYDAEGRLTKACKTSNCADTAERVEFTYDGEGRRTEIRTAPANVTAFTTLELRYQGSSAVEEWTNGTLTRSYTVDEAGTILKLTIPSGQTGAGTYLVSWNGHGDALALHRQNGDGTLTLANSFIYSTWGAPSTTTHNSVPDLGFRYLYVGQFGVQWDNSFGLGLHYMQARHYSPALARFIQPDPSRLEANHYAYGGNSPVTKLDPDGLLGNRYQANALEQEKCNRDRVSCNRWKNSAADAHLISILNYPFDGVRRDSIRHCVWMCLLTVHAGAHDARDWGYRHEIGNGWRLSSWADVRNNEVGIEFGKALKQEWLSGLQSYRFVRAETMCLQALAQGRLLMVVDEGTRIVRSTRR